MTSLGDFPNDRITFLFGNDLIFNTLYKVNGKIEEKNDIQNI